MSSDADDAWAARAVIHAPQEVPMDCRSLVLALCLLFAATPSQAIQLHWGSGADTLTSASAIRCTFLLQADESEQSLPGEWRLVWTGDSCSVDPIVVDPPACSSAIAEVSALDPAATAVDSAAHLSTAYFCSSGSAPETAMYALDLPGYARAKFKVV